MDLGRTYLGETFGERDDLTASDFLVLETFGERDDLTASDFLVLERDEDRMMSTCIL